VQKAEQAGQQQGSGGPAPAAAGKRPCNNKLAARLHIARLCTTLHLFLALTTSPCLHACSDDVGKATAMEGLQRLEGYVRKHIGKQVRCVGAWGALGGTPLVWVA